MAKSIRITATEVLSDYFFPLKKVIYESQSSKGEHQQLTREVYCSKDGATALLYNKEKETVILIKQFRMPAYLNHHSTGVLLEACAGILEEGEEPMNTIIREIEEETGYEVTDAKKIFELYMTPGTVSEKLHFFIAAYTPENKVNEGGGVKSENEDLEVAEMPFEQAYNKLRSGEIVDAKTVLLLQYARIHLFPAGKNIPTAIAPVK